MSRLSAATLLLGAALATLDACSCKKAGSQPPGPVATLKFAVGVETASGFQPLLPAGQPLPVARSQTYRLAAQGEEPLRIALAQQRPGGVTRLHEVVEPARDAGRERAGALLVVEVDAGKQLRVTVTTQTTPPTIRSYGPFAVE